MHKQTQADIITRQKDRLNTVPTFRSIAFAGNYTVMQFFLIEPIEHF